MCDTIVIVTPGRVLFAKNSDRDPNEGQNLEWHPGRSNGRGATVGCTHIEIPDVEQTYATLISRPFWMWGAEMGANECGVVIGNEAVFTNQPYRDTGLLGMDLLRLALERAATAEEACSVITTLLEEHGQGGGCGHETRTFTYHNSFIIADGRGAFVLETADGYWAVEAVTGVRTISNGLTILDFANQFSDSVRTKVSGCATRQARTEELAEDATSALDLMALLRDHGNGNEGSVYRFTNGGLNAPCVHGGGMIASSQTTASWVAELTPNSARHWATGTAAPCTGLFKPVSIDAPVSLTPRAEDTVNDSLWWRHERLHRTVVRNPMILARLYREERDAIEREWVAAAPASEHAFAKGDELLAKWTAAVAAHEVEDVRPFWVRNYWEKRNRRAGLTLPVREETAHVDSPVAK